MTTATMAELGAYCERDVAPTRLVDRELPELGEFEMQVWRTTERMNDRGVAVDPSLLPRIAALIDQAKADLNRRISLATGGAIPTVSNHVAVKEWINAQGYHQVESADKASIAHILEEPGLPDAYVGVLEMRQAGGGVSASKYAAIRHRLSADGRLRGALVYCGAEMTGRWSSRGAQLQNMNRGGKVDATAAIADILAGMSLADLEQRHGPALVMAGELLRPAFIAGVL